MTVFKLMRRDPLTQMQPQSAEAQVPALKQKAQKSGGGRGGEGEGKKRN